MLSNNILQIVIYFIILFACIKPVGSYMAYIYQDNRIKFLNPIENSIYWCCGVNSKENMDWKRYMFSMLAFNIFSFIVVYVLQVVQNHLPLNPAHMPAVSSTIAFNTAVSFVSNTNWQAYGGETTMSYFTQMVLLTVQNFVSAATGMSILMAFIRGLAWRETKNLGNFWRDLVRSTLYILLPLSIILAIILISQGVIQNFDAYKQTSLIDPVSYQVTAQDHGQHKVYNKQVTTQTIPMGPVASQTAIDEIGSNGGGYFNVNSSHPFQNPTPITNFLEMLVILLIPAALCYTYGVMINDKRQGWAILTAMFIIFIPLLYLCIHAEQHANPLLAHLGINSSAGNMEGKEVRFGAMNSALWTTMATAVSNGSVNSMIDSYMPMGTLVPLLLMQLGEVVFGGVGCGLYGMLVFVILTVFIVGLMVGRTPEYLGKKIEAYDMKLIAWMVLIMPITVLITTAIALLLGPDISAVHNPGARGFMEILYAMTSMGNNNGSAMAGLNSDTNYFTIVGGIVMVIGRYALAIPILMLAGSLGLKKRIPVNSGTLATHNLTFIILLVCVVVVIGALTFLPSLALGSIVNYLQLWGY